MYRILHRKCGRTVFTHELLTYQKSNEWDFWYKNDECVYKAFALTWPASIQIYWNKRKRLHKKRVHLPLDLCETPTWSAISLFWDTNMTAVTSCEHTLYRTKHFRCGIVLLYTYWDIHCFGSLFISDFSKMLKFAATNRGMTNKTKHQLISKNAC